MLPAPRSRTTLTVLGLETSCDDTAAAVIRRAPDGAVAVLSEAKASQDDAHAPYGGIVPEIAARAHAARIDGVAARALAEAGLAAGELDGVGATAGPGLIGGLTAGVMAGKALAIAGGAPFVAVNHLEGHALSPRLEGAPEFPYLLLLVSGGHTQLVWVADVGAYRRLGSTIDDAAGEAFDKTAKHLGLPHPGGPALERLAAAGDPSAIALPRPFVGADHADFSFAGLKTAARRAIDAIPADADAATARADLAAGFQATVAAILADRVGAALARAPGRPTALVAAGGVAANAAVRRALADVAEDAGIPFRAPPPKWCVDNGAMIALAAAERLARGPVDDLDASARPRWPLDPRAAAVDPVLGGGRKGPKA